MTGFVIIQGKHRLETHASPGSAYRAYLILLAHEKTNNRSGNDLSIEPPVKCFLEDLPFGLPSWAEEVLGKEFLKSISKPRLSGSCGCGSTKYGPNHKPWDHAGWSPD